MEVETKRCRYCWRELPLSEFYKSKITKDGHQAYCRECMNTYSRIRYRRIVSRGGSQMLRLRDMRHRYYQAKRKAKQDENNI